MFAFCMQALPVQNTLAMFQPGASLALLQISLSVISVASAPFPRQVLPPQPRHVMLSLMCDSEQICLLVMFAHESSSHLRHMLPLQPREEMLSCPLECLQSVGSVICVASAPRSRHLLPPQPWHVMFSLFLASLQMPALVMLPQLAVFSPMQKLPPQPMDFRPNLLMDWWHQSTLVIRLTSDVFVRQTLPLQPTHLVENMSWDEWHAASSVISSHLAVAVSSTQREPVQPLHLRPHLPCFAALQMVLAVMELQVEFTGRHLVPPQPMHLRPWSLQALAQPRTVVRSQQVAS
mmetsp:Transcript_42677/g.121685  ORF Transcript_42677/g.121685 Transcript_42677/m.121685 type:complete len:291 (-) Transcript_42677:1198-2070(-)